MSHGTLASTGATVTIGSIVLNQVQLVGIVFAMVLIGALLVRVGFRRGKSAREV